MPLELRGKRCTSHYIGFDQSIFSRAKIDWHASLLHAISAANTGNTLMTDTPVIIHCFELRLFISRYNILYMYVISCRRLIATAIFV